MSSNNYSKLVEIQDLNTPSIVTFAPEQKNIYEVDLNTRTIEEIKNTIVVETDHKAETIYFKVPRYFDNMDLSSTVCLIQYENVKRERRVYAVPFYDIDSAVEINPETKIEKPAMLIPWIVSECVTPDDGTVTFSLKFYKIEKSGDKFTYVLNTLPSTLHIEKGIGFNPEDIQTEDEYAYLESAYLGLLSNAAQAAQEGSLTWIVLN